MRERLVGLGLLLGGNAVGLLVAAVLFEKFELDALSFVVDVVVFTVVLAVAAPLLRRVAEAKAPALTAFLAVITTWVALLVTDLLLDGLSIEGVGTWIGATLVVWAFVAISAVVLPRLFGVRGAGR